MLFDSPDTAEGPSFIESFHHAGGTMEAQGHVLHESQSDKKTLSGGKTRPRLPPPPSPDQQPCCSEDLVTVVSPG